MRLPILQLSLSLLLSAACLVLSTTAESAQTPLLISQFPPDSSDSSPSKGSGRGGLDGNQICNQAVNSSRAWLTILIPEDKPLVTTSEQPTLWIYVPYAVTDVASLRFSLERNDQTMPPYRDVVNLPDQPGIIGIRLPKSLIESGKGYRWYLKLYCQGNQGVEPNQDVYAGLSKLTRQSVNTTTTLPKSWNYDQVTTLARQRLADPTNIQLQRQWVELLTAIGRAEIAQEPLLGEIELPAP